MEKKKYYSKTLENLKKIDNEELIKRYLKKNHKNQEKLGKTINVVINKREDDGVTFIYGAIACLEGKNLSHILFEVFHKNNSAVINAGYQFKVENIVSDINTILNDNQVLTLQSRKNANELSDFVKETVEEFVGDILIDKVLTPILQKDIVLNN